MNLLIHHSSFTTHNLFVLFVQSVAAAATTELFELQPVRRVLLVLCSHVIPLFALGALQNYVISWHFRSSFVARCSRQVLRRSTNNDLRTTNESFYAER